MNKLSNTLPDEQTIYINKAEIPIFDHESWESTVSLTTVEKINSLYQPSKEIAENPEDIILTPCLTEPEPPTHDKRDPTRFGDWESNGRCIDF